MANEGRVFLERWHQILTQRDRAGLEAILAEDIVMGPPPHWTKLEGKPMVSRVLGIIMGTLEDFAYHREWIDGNELALEFTARVGRLKLHGIDLISVDGEGKMRRLDVMIRPLNALAALAELVGKKIAEGT
jgi:hypothetical protein